MTTEKQLGNPAPKGFSDKLRLSICWGRFLVSSFFKRVKPEDMYFCFGLFLLSACCYVVWNNLVGFLVSAFSTGTLAVEFVSLLLVSISVVVAGGVYCFISGVGRLNRLVEQYEATS